MKKVPKRDVQSLFKPDSESYFAFIVVLTSSYFLSHFQYSLFPAISREETHVTPNVNK